MGSINNQTTLVTSLNSLKSVPGPCLFESFLILTRSTPFLNFITEVPKNPKFSDPKNRQTRHGPVGGIGVETQCSISGFEPVCLGAKPATVPHYTTSAYNHKRKFYNNNIYQFLLSKRSSSIQLAQSMYRILVVRNKVTYSRNRSRVSGHTCSLTSDPAQRVIYKAIVLHGLPNCLIAL